jgi:hypothetical protein
MKTSAKTLSLTDFVKAEKRANCNVCKLPVEVRGQLGRPASEKKISREQQVKWIYAVTGKTITLEELNSHNNGKHDG